MMCANPEKCAEEAAWIFIAGSNGWTEVMALITSNHVMPGHPDHRRAQGVCYMLPNPVRFNTFSGEQLDGIQFYTHAVNVEPPKTIWRRIAEWCKS